MSRTSRSMRAWRISRPSSMLRDTNRWTCRRGRRGGQARDGPTLVLHPRDDALVPFSEGRLLSTQIPGARFVGLDGRNHIPLADDPAWDQFRAELHAFLGTMVEAPPPGDLADLSTPECEVLALVAEGLSNEEIAARLCLSNRTVERHLSNIYAKLRVSGKAARAAAAARFSRLREPPAV